MKSIVEIEINVPQQQLAELYADPRNNPKWMHEGVRYEPVGGEEGMPGSTYRLMQINEGMVFLATVVARNLPDELKLNLEASDVDVAIICKMIALSPTKTKLISEEVFTFKGPGNATANSSVEDAKKAAHRRHMEDFKSFAESQRLE